MRRSDFVMKLMSVVLLAAIAVYIGIYIYNGAENTLKTAVAVRYTAEQSGATEGYAVREEFVLTGGGSTVTLMVSEGEKVASGETLAVSYQGAEALARASEIRALQLRISAAEDGAGASGSAKPSGPADSVLALANAVQHKNLENLQYLALTVENRIFTQSAGKLTGADLTAMKTRLNALLAQNSDAKTVASPSSGVFSAVVDGLESVGPDKLKNLTPSALQLLFSVKRETSGDALGKLIGGITWYYASVMDQADAVRLKAGKTTDIQFTKTYNARLPMKVESVGAAEGGKCVVVFSAKTGLSDIAALRRLTGRVPFDSITGLLVPREAIHREDGGKPYIYLLTGLQAEKVPVTILCENGDSTVVQDGARNGTVLREGSQIIVKAKELYDGKVVGR